MSDTTIFDGGSPSSDTESTTLGYQPSTRRVQDVLTQVQRTFGDTDGVQIQASDVIAWVNDAQDTIANVNRPLKARAVTDSIAGTARYKLPNMNILQVESLHYDNIELPNTPYPQAEIDFIGSTQSGAPTTWYEWGGTFGLYPVPNESKSLRIYYTMVATRVASVSDLLGVPDKYYQAVVAYVLQQAYELDENFDASERKRSQVSNMMETFDEEERTAQHMTYEKITYEDAGW